MKLFTIISFTILLLVSCEPTKRERQIIGKWSYSSTYTDNIKSNDVLTGTMTYLIENVDEFCDDFTEKEFGTFQIFFNLFFNDNDVPYTVILEYDTDYQGIWSLDGDEIVLKGDYCTFKFSKGYQLDPEANQDVEYYVKQLKAYTDTAIVQPIIDTLLEEHKAEVFELSNDKLTLKYEGEAVMQTLTKIKKQ